MKRILNRFLKPFNAEIHGIGYIRKLQKSNGSRDAMETQSNIFSGKADVIFDVGANRGTVTKQYLQMFPRATIHAFEPSEEFVEAFNKANPDRKHIHLNHLALAQEEGVADFHMNAHSDTSSLLETISIGASSDRSCATIEIRKVQTLPLDKYCSSRGINYIDILKLDTQGAELSILKGAEEMLKEQKIGLIYTEAYFKPQYKDQPMLYDIANYLMQFGYYLEGIYDPYFNDKLMLWCDAIFLPVKSNKA